MSKHQAQAENDVASNLEEFGKIDSNVLHRFIKGFFKEEQSTVIQRVNYARGETLLLDTVQFQNKYFS